MSLSSRLPSRYRLDSSLGKGGFGEVHKAYDAELGRIVAIKILTNVTQESRSSLKREFEVLSKLSHPYLVKVYGYGFISDDTPYYTMEYIDGQDLKTFLSSPSAMTHVPYIIDQALQALSYLHEKQIIHGDIKPENIFISISRDNTVSTKILDFGLASTIQDSSARISGTPRFMALEILSHREYSPASDLYALGITFIESITRLQPPAANDIKPSFYKKVHDQLSSSLASNRIANPSAITSFILNLSDKDSTNRPKNAKEAIKKFSTIVDIYSQDIAHKLDNIFIDRYFELKIIRDFISKNSDDTRVLTLEGPTGIGKKALMSKSIANAQPEGYFVLDLSDPSFTRNPIERLIETISNNISPSKRNKFQRRHSKILELIYTRFESEKSLADNMRVAYSNIIEYLHAISGDAPILLSIPNIERFSEDFYHFVVQLIHELHLEDTNMRLIISRNTDKRSARIISETLARSASLGYSARIEIKPFTYTEIEELQNTLFNGILFNKHHTQQILKETDGTPLLIIEYIKHLLANGAIQLERGVWTLDQALHSQVPIPGRIEEYINEEYSKFDRPTKHLLQLLAFWGRDISRNTLLELSGILGDEIDSMLMPLLDSMIIERSGDSEYRFKHDAYIKYVKKRTSKGRVINIHASILRYLENSASTDYERLATHSIESLSIDKSMEYVFMAVDLMEQRLEYYRCYELLSKQKMIITKHGNTEQLIKVLDRIAPIEQRIGLHDKALSDYSYLLTSAIDLTTKAYYSRAVAHLQNKYFGDQSNAIKTINNALSYADETLNPLLMANLLLELGIIEGSKRALLCKKASDLAKDIDVNLYAKSIAFLMDAFIDSGEHAKASTLEKELISLLDEVEPYILWHVYFSLHKFNFYAGDYDRAKYYTEESIKICNELCDDFNLIADYNHLGGLYYIQGKYFDQISSLKTAVSKLCKYNTYNASIYFSNISLAFRCVGDYREARKALQLANDYCNHLAEQYPNEWVLTKFVHLYALFGDAEYQNYYKYLRKNVIAAKQSGNSIVFGHIKLISSIFYYQRMQYAYSIRNMRAALKEFRQANDRDDIVDTLTLRTMILLEKGDLKEASKAVTEARKIFDEIHCDYLKPQLLLAEGALARAHQSEAAEAKLKEALKTSKKMFTREYTWQIQRELALHLKDRGELHKALQYYRDAIDMIKEITETIDGEELKTSYLSLPFRKRVFDEIKALKKQLN